MSPDAPTPSQFTSEAFTSVLRKRGIAISMDGMDRAFGNIMVERLWRTVKYEDVYLRDYHMPAEARVGSARYFAYYNHLRRHRTLGHRTPANVYGLAVPTRRDSLRSSSGHVIHADGSTLFQAGICPAHGDMLHMRLSGRVTLAYWTC